MAGVKGRSGRRRKVRNILKYFNDQVDLNSAKLIDVTIEKALEGDREMIIYCWDRRLGKPKQSTDIDITGGEELTAGLVAQLFTMLATRRKELDSVKLIEEGKEDAI